MITKDKKIECAKKILHLIENRNYTEQMGGRDGALIRSLTEMSEGKDVSYSEEIRWLKIDSTPEDAELSKLFSQLGELDSSIKIKRSFFNFFKKL